MKNRLPGGRPIWLVGIITGYGLLLAVLTALNGSGADRWWIGAFNLYLPQVLWLAPVLVLGILAWRRARRWLWVLSSYAIWIGGPLMGFCWGLGGHREPSPLRATLRVMTCNIKYGRRDLAALISEIVRHKPDVVFLQDVENTMEGPLGAFFRNWTVCSYGQYVIASRWPLGKPEVCPISPADGPECLVRTALLFGQTPISLYDVHLLTPRGGLNALRVARRRPGRLPEAVQDLQDNVEQRILEAGKASELVRQEQGAVILAGDLNSPDQSLACRALRQAGLHDAFAEGGSGYGYTYGHFLLRGRIPWLPHASWMRIDHIMLSSRLRAVRCWTGTGEASDHRPVYADLDVPVH